MPKPMPPRRIPVSGGPKVEPRLLMATPAKKPGLFRHAKDAVLVVGSAIAIWIAIVVAIVVGDPR
jgi:hypothetical protein